DGRLHSVKRFQVRRQALDVEPFWSWKQSPKRPRISNNVNGDPSIATIELRVRREVREGELHFRLPIRGGGQDPYRNPTLSNSVLFLSLDREPFCSVHDACPSRLSLTAEEPAEQPDLPRYVSGVGMRLDSPTLQYRDPQRLHSRVER